MLWMEGKEGSNKASESSPLNRLEGHACLARASTPPSVDARSSTSTSARSQLLRPNHRLTRESASQSITPLPIRAYNAA